MMAENLFLNKKSTYEKLFVMKIILKSVISSSSKKSKYLGDLIHY